MIRRKTDQGRTNEMTWKIDSKDRTMGIEYEMIEQLGLEIFFYLKPSRGKMAKLIHYAESKYVNWLWLNSRSWLFLWEDLVDHLVVTWNEWNIPYCDIIYIFYYLHSKPIYLSRAL